MRHLLTSLALFATFAAAGQSTMPYNPDADDDSYIGATDLLGLLPLFGQQIGIDSSLTCDYDGTPIEEFWGNVWNGDIIIDSMLVQYHTIDSAQVFIAGCPDPAWETVSYERAWMTGPATYELSNSRVRWDASLIGYSRSFFLFFYPSNGDFRFRIFDTELDQTGLTDIIGSHSSYAQSTEVCCDVSWLIPFPLELGSFDESGIHFEEWGGFLTNATYVNILPYWHYAE
jgi:hypothetical protein